MSIPTSLMGITIVEARRDTAIVARVAVAVTACVRFATIAMVAFVLRSALACASWARATTSNTTTDNRAQVLDAVGAVRVANLPYGRLAALCDHPGRIPSKLSVHPDEGGVHAVAEQHGLGGSHRDTLHRQR